MPLEKVQLGHFQLLDLIGQSGRGEVYVARDTHPQQDHRQFAIRVLRDPTDASPATQTSENDWSSRQRALSALTRLDHPHILPILEVGQERFNDATLFYFVMPFCSEGSFSDWLHRCRDARPLSLQEAAYFIQQASAALQYLHERRILHRHVTPTNFLIRSWRGESALPDLLLTDFGPGALAAEMAALSVQGTPEYMAPEQWEEAAVPASDQYALAVMAYQLLTGRTPFLGTPKLVQHQHCFVSPQPPSVFKPEIPLALDAVLLRALAKKAEDRFPSLAAFGAAFEQAASQQIESLEARSTRKIPALHPDEFVEGNETIGDTQTIRAEAPSARSAPAQQIMVVEGSLVPAHSEGTSTWMAKKTTAQTLAVVPRTREMPVPFSSASSSSVSVAPAVIGRRPRRHRLFLGLLLVVVLAVSGFLFAPLVLQKTGNSLGSNPTGIAQSDGTGTLARGTPWVPVTVTPASTVDNSLPGTTPAATVQGTPTIVSTGTPTVTPTPKPTPGPGSYTFEDGGIDGWVGLGTGVSNVKNTTVKAEQGTHSLAATVYYTSGQAAPYVAAQNSHGIGIPQPGQTMSVYVYPVAPGSSQTMQVRLTVTDGAHTAWNGPLVTLRPNYWNYLVYPIPTTVGQTLVTCGVQFFTAPTKVSWNVMIDNMVWS